MREPVFAVMSDNYDFQPRLRKACEPCRSVNRTSAIPRHCLLTNGAGERRQNVLAKNPTVRHAHALVKDAHMGGLKTATGYRRPVKPMVPR
jgi:hypothetical protein